MFKKLLFIPAYLFIAVLFGCLPKTEIREYRDPAETITVKKGENFAIALKSNRTTGFIWRLAKPIEGGMVKIKHSEYVPDEPQRIGSGGKEVWIFEALGPGKKNIDFESFFKI